MVTFVDAIGFVNAYPNSSVWVPRQPIGTEPANSEWNGELEMFRYDLITPYGPDDNQVSNPDQDSGVMVAWDLLLKMTVLVDKAVTFRLYGDIFHGTYALLNTVAILADTELQVFSYPAAPVFFLKGTFERATADATSLRVHTSMVSY